MRLRKENTKVEYWHGAQRGGFGEAMASQSTTIVVVNFPEMGYFLEQENGHN
jgi:hypothetical protein